MGRKGIREGSVASKINKVVNMAPSQLPLTAKEIGTELEFQFPENSIPSAQVSQGLTNLTRGGYIKCKRHSKGPRTYSAIGTTAKEPETFNNGDKKPSVNEFMDSITVKADIGLGLPQAKAEAMVRYVAYALPRNTELANSVIKELRKESLNSLLNEMDMSPEDVVALIQNS